MATVITADARADAAREARQHRPVGRPADQLANLAELANLVNRRRRLASALDPASPIQLDRISSDPIRAHRADLALPDLISHAGLPGEKFDFWSGKIYE